MTRNVLCDLKTEEITTRHALEALRGDWTQLWRRCPFATPFQSPEWLIPWWKHFHPGQLWTLALWCGGTLVGLAPLFEAKDVSSRQRIVPLGIGNSDSIDLLIDPQMTNLGRRKIVHHVARRARRWHVWELHRLPKASPFLPAPRMEGRSPEIKLQEPCLVLTIPPNARAIDECIPGRQFRRLQYCRRRLAAAGEFKCEDVDAGNWDQQMETLFHLHTRRWNARGGAGVLTDATVRAFHREVAVEMLAQDRLLLSVLTLSGAPIAALYGFHSHKRTYYYLGGFAPEYRRFSPGLVMVGQAIEQAIDAGAEEFHFLRGCESYKYDWGAADREHLLIRYRSDSA